MTYRPPAEGVGRDDLATKAQVKAIYMYAREMGLSEAQVKQRTTERYHRHPEELSKAEANRIINWLKAMVDKPAEQRAEVAAPPPTPKELLQEYLGAAEFTVVTHGPRFQVWEHPQQPGLTVLVMRAGGS